MSLPFHSSLAGTNVHVRSRRCTPFATWVSRRQTRVEQRDEPTAASVALRGPPEVVHRFASALATPALRATSISAAHELDSRAARSRRTTASSAGLRRSTAARPTDSLGLTRLTSRCPGHGSAGACTRPPTSMPRGDDSGPACPPRPRGRRGPGRSGRLDRRLGRRAARLRHVPAGPLDRPPRTPGSGLVLDSAPGPTTTSSCEMSRSDLMHVSGLITVVSGAGGLGGRLSVVARGRRRDRRLRSAAAAGPGRGAGRSSRTVRLLPRLTAGPHRPSGLADARSESPGESVTRVQFFRYGIPKPELQVRVVNVRGDAHRDHGLRLGGVSTSR